MSGDSDCKTTLLDCGHEVLDEKQPHYCSYIALNRLPPAKPHIGTEQERNRIHDDEHWFIRVHHLSELAFDEIVFNLHRAIAFLQNDDLQRAHHVLWRVNMCVTMATEIVRPLSTMRQADFFTFREALKPASGAESIGARRLELLAGMREDTPYVEERGQLYTYRQFLDRRPGPGKDDPKTRWWTSELTELAREPSIVCVFKQMLANREITLRGLHALTDQKRQDGVLPAPFTDREDEIKWLKLICDKIFNLEEGWLAWRDAHLAATRPQLKGHDGTGHTTGIPYLESVANRAKFYPELANLRLARGIESKPEGAWI